jgi:hypothetical protein
MNPDALIPPLLSPAALGPASRRSRAPALAQIFAQMAEKLDPETPPPGQAVVVQIQYDAVGDEPPMLGDQYVLVLPEKAPSADLWYERVAKPFFLQRLLPEERKR